MPNRHQSDICFERLARSLLARLASERGIALPVATMLLLVISTLGFVVYTQAVTSGDQAQHDQSVKRAVAAADAGSDTAVYRLNKMRPAGGDCVIVGSSGTLATQAADSDGWCPAVEEDLGDGARYSYQASKAESVALNGQSFLQRKVVSTGIVTLGTGNEVKRRSLAVVGANTGNTLVGQHAIISTDTSQLDIGNSTKVVGDIGTNGNVRLSGTAVVCGDIIYGQGKQYTAGGGGQGGAQCTTSYQDAAQPYEAPQPYSLGPVEQGNAPTQNDNASIPANLFDNDDRSTRVLRLEAGESLTLTGNVYSFCFVELSGTAVVNIAPRQPWQPPLRIYIDKPENCDPNIKDKNNKPAAGSFSMGNSATINNLNSDPSTLIVLMVGSANISTFADFDNTSGSTMAMVLYAPYTLCDIRNATRITGAVACKQVSVRNSAQITWDPLVGYLTLNVVPLYRRQSFVECATKPSTTAPDSSCS